MRKRAGAPMAPSYTGRTELRAWFDMPYQRVRFCLRMTGGDGRHYAAEKVKLVEARNGEQANTICELRLEDAQVLMDDLWKSGLRPTEGKGSAGAMAATERHLDDMRALVSHLSEARLP